MAAVTADMTAENLAIAKGEMSRMADEAALASSDALTAAKAAKEAAQRQVLFNS